MYNALNFHDLRRAARSRLPSSIFEYIDRGTEDENSLRDTHQSLACLKITPHVLTAGSIRDTTTTLFGKRYSAPIVVAPTACAGLVWHKGEIALAQAAQASGIPFCAATEAMTSIDDIVRGTSSEHIWFQLYVWENEQLSHELIRRVQALGVQTLVVTIDTPVAPNREYNTRNGMGMPFKISPKLIADVATHPSWLLNVLVKYLMDAGVPRFANYPDEYRTTLIRGGKSPEVHHNSNLSWDLIKTIRDLWKGQLVLKGILHPDDALKAVEHGVDGIIVSNHGSRNLDSAISPIDALDALCAAVKGQMTIIMDSGIRRGSDIFKALALGADAVMIGRGFLYGTALGGKSGAEHTYSLYLDELKITMASAGCATLGDIRQAEISRVGARES
ncbi:alpha-hydroxy acid oxidase [Pseudomonas sp. L13]|uniref:alpha-hydroxy acid oxidase n=1 Tax=Pseudomonas sp. L13 TaxID=343985 RepID=UPI00137B47B0|nr:alpha-hydroxy acid oxidase [Pseudomonas sp. L13]NCE89184.1 alpha-hydroxy-acid oxidizing protein [Pseudomonas sp. L13]